ncbi:chemotaxis protein CheW [Modestobacter sp. VKM Ac-2979]|uniref:chemotaxis protein CheW n=1 Tax=unclassified Modestobacter TaxID=2643866 RepID=UPI0022AB5EC7|nr:MULTISPECIES: chemotaxis protein CheW [unclassified Modestobacter]MCZ2813303.1 chemotaxis protein CheW [Modestobacter sp. VKM Ac-2979]MCZ2842505.1 chemotaxis protein CheW [Modestobacter sp. VKM Ac-2980]
MTGVQPAASTGAAAGEVYGMIRLAGVDVALPLAVLREVVPCPAELAGLPADAVGLLGAMDLRTTVLPVVDLRLVLGRPAARHPGQVVVVVAVDGQSLGLLADEVCGVARVPHTALLPMRVAAGELLFSHTFQHPETGRATSVLDAAAVVCRPGLPTVADVARSASSVGAGGPVPSGDRTSVTLLRCGPHVLALDVAQVHTTLPSPSPRPSVLSGSLCPGVTGFAGQDVAVVDPLALLGLGSLGTATAEAGVVVDTGSGHVVLAVDALIALTDLAEGAVLPVPAFAVPRPELLRGLADVDGTTCLVLDGAALLADPRVLALAAMNTPAAGADPGSPGGSGRASATGAPPYLTFSVGIDVTTPLEQVGEIVPYPAEVTGTSVGQGVLGVVVHRGAAVPVLCLATLLGLPQLQVTAASCLLVVDVGEPVAFAVDALRSIDPLTWTDPDQPGRPGADRLADLLRRSPLVQVGADTRLLPCLDLQHVARTMHGRSAVPAPRPALDEELLVH